MIVVVGGIKGGTGKTTLATNLTVLLSQKEKSVLLVDGDEQKSASDWVDQRISLGLESSWITVQLSGQNLYKEVRKLSSSVNHVIIDCGGRDVSTFRSSLCVADVLLIPFRPKSYDVWTCGKMNQLIGEVKSINPNIRCLSVINQADSVGCDNKDAKEALSEFTEISCLPIFIGYRKAFASAAGKGLGVTELKPIDKKAVTEIESLFELIYTV